VLPKIIFRSMGLVVLCLGSVCAFAQQFSADMVRQKPEGTPVSKVAVKGEKIRFAVNGKDPSKESIVVIDLKEETGFMVLPDNKSYTPMMKGRIATAMPFFRPTDAENACPSWEAYVHQPSSCSKVGNETVDDRETVKYKGVARNGDTGFAWVDRKLNFVTKWEGEKGAVAFKNIQEGPQSLALFTVPSGFQEMDSVATHKPSSKAKTAKKPFPTARPAIPPQPATAPQPSTTPSSQPAPQQ
jgi:hypothetical protein